jgi:hypothetical protein
MTCKTDIVRKQQGVFAGLPGWCPLVVYLMWIVPLVTMVTIVFSVCVHA